MAASKGRSFVLQIGDGATSEAFNTILGQRSTSISVTVDGVDITDKDASGIRTFLEGAGVKDMKASISGVYKDDTYVKLLRTKCMAQAHWNYKVIDTETGDYYSVTMFATNFDESGEYNGEKAYSASLQSTGAFSFTEV